MKKKFFIVALATLSMCLGACSTNQNNNSQSTDVTSQVNEEIYEIFRLYKASGGTMTYEEWLASIKGADGSSLLNGTADPTASLGNNGDTYINTSSWDVFVKTGGSWSKVGNIMGQQGPKGDQGDIGPQGPQGEPGQDSPHFGETHKVTYHLNGGSIEENAPEFVTVNWGDCIELPVPTRKGYSFLGWWLESDDINNPTRQWFTTDAVFVDLDLYAHWEEKTYQITLNSDGGTFAGDRNISVKYLSNYQLPTDVKKVSHSFIGWFNGNTQVAFSGVYNYTTNLTLLAKYEELSSYTITLNPNGGTCGTTSLQVEYNGEYQLPSYESITRENYVFMGWYNGETKWDFSGTYLLKSDLTLAAKWEERKTYSASLNFNGGSYNNSSENLQYQFTNENRYNGGEHLPIPIKQGYTFIGYARGMSLFTQNDLLFNWTYLSSNNSFKALWLANDGSLSGDVYKLGNYPQSAVTEENVISNLEKLNPTQNGYYQLNDKDYYYKTGKWFNVEPILWYILDHDSGLMTTLFSLDNILYYKCSAWDNTRTVEGITVYPNNYKYSNVRAWLNGLDGTNYNVSNYTNNGFYDVAFSNFEKAKIKKDTVTNYSSTNQYSCDDTQDKVFLLSESEACLGECVVLPQNDFSANSSHVSTTWWTRTPCDYNSTWIDAIGYDGRFDYKIDTYNSVEGVRPAIKVL